MRRRCGDPEEKHFPTTKEKKREEKSYGEEM
jgi:hypothetical protein